MVALLTMAVAAVIVIGIAFGWFLSQAWRTSSAGYLRNFYDLEEHHLNKAWRQRWRIAVSWTKARLPDHLGLTVTALTLAGIIGTATFNSLAKQPSATYWVTTLAHIGQWLVLAAAGALFGLTRQAFTSSGKRRQIGVLWDVGTFWPRASQPLAPPCYMERSVPETVNRLRRALGDHRRDGPHSHTDPATDQTEAAHLWKLCEEFGPDAAHRILLRQDWVLINGYSQGSPIAAAIIAQLPQELRDKTSLVTVGCPLRRLYGRAFPTYFGQRRLLELASKLSPPQDGQPQEPITDITQARARVLPTARWRNLIRPSDYIGSYIFSNPMDRPDGNCDIDKRVLDPPRIIPAHGTTPPPIHEHSDYWPDPQTAVYTQELLRQNRLWPADPNPAARGMARRL
jgi:hypothetical protein